MTKNFINMLKLFVCGAVGKEFSADGKVNIAEVRRLAIEQSVWQTVFAGISESRAKGNLSIEDDEFSKYKSEVMASVRSSLMRNEFTEKFLSENSQGLKYCVLKGRTAARLYKNPDMRVSSDVDILIEEADISKWTERLKKYGYSVEIPNGIEHHFAAFHFVGGILELHTEMYYRTTKNILLKGLVEYREPYTDCGGFPSLGINDALMFLTAHLLKHFLNGAAGLRQIADLLLHMNHFKNDIDWEKYNKLTKKLGFSGFVSAVCGIGVKYFGFSFENADGNAGDMLLNDSEIGGNFGHNSNEHGLYYVVLKERSGMSEREFNRYYDKNSRGGTLSRMFPKMTEMQKQFPVLYKAPILLPVCHAARLGGIFVRVVSGKRKINNLPDGNSDDLSRRIKLVKSLGMMK